MNEIRFYIDGHAVTQTVARSVGRLGQAAIDYVAARIAQEAAEPRDWTSAAAEVDRTWHGLVEAAMPPDPETGAQ